MAIGDKYRAVHQRSLKDPEAFWAEQAAAIDWSKRWDKVLDDSKAPFYRWFAGGELNTLNPGSILRNGVRYRYPITRHAGERVPTIRSHIHAVALEPL